LILKKNIIAYLFVLIQISVFSQNFHSTNISVSEGLLTNSIYDIFQDELGNMWFATDLGVCKYNGYKFTNYTTKNGLTHNVVFQINEYNNILYFNTYKGGICFLDGDSIFPYQFNDILLNKIEDQFVQDFIFEGDDLWFNLFNTNGLFTINKEGIFDEVKMGNKQATFYVKELNGEKICGFLDMIHKSNNFKITEDKNVKITIPTISFNLSLRPIIYKDYFAYGKIIIRYDSNQIKEVKILSKEVLSIFKDKKDNLWIGTYGGGVLLYKNSILNNTPELYLKGKTISDIFEDSQGNLWFSTTENGLYYLKTNKSMYYQFDEQITNIKCSGSYIFCGTANGNVYKLVGKEKKLIYNNSTGFAIKDIYTIDNSHILVHYKKINHINNTQVDFNPFTSDFNNIYTNHGKYFVTAYNGFKLFDGNAVFYNSMDNNFEEKVKKLLSFSNDSLLLLCSSGLYLFNDNTISKIQIDGVDELEITSLCKWKNQLLISTKNYGVVFLNNSFQTLKILNKNLGLSSDNCLTVHLNENKILIGTNKGLDIVSETKKGFEIQQINTSNLLYNHKINCIGSSEDKIVIGTDYGVEIFQDSKIEYKFNPTQITSFKVNDVSGNLNNLTFRHNQNNIEIFFVSPNFGKEVNYKYRLLGATNKWSITKNNSIKYSQLSSGDYTFEVQPFVHNQFGNLSKVSLNIKPHFTKTWWFFIVITLLVLWVIYLIIADMKIKEKYKREAIKSTQKALRAQMNPHFLFNALNSIQSYIFSNEKELSMRYLNKFSSLVRKVLDNSMHDYITIKDDLSALEDYMELEKIRFEGKFEYEINIDEKLDINNYFIPPLLLQPVVENAIWHGLLHKLEKNGKITISFRLENNTIICAITDNGVGRKRAEQLEKIKTHKSVGIQITKERLKVINTQSKEKIYLQLLDLNPDQLETGTKVKIILPILEK